jgi:hypothetical protein
MFLAPPPAGQNRLCSNKRISGMKLTPMKLRCGSDEVSLVLDNPREDVVATVYEYLEGVDPAEVGRRFARAYEMERLLEETKTLLEQKGLEEAKPWYTNSLGGRTTPIGPSTYEKIAELLS